MEVVKLEMDFLDELNKVTKITLDDPRDDLLPSEIQAAMDNIISENVFKSRNGEFTVADKARLVTTNISEMEF